MDLIPPRHGEMRGQSIRTRCDDVAGPVPGWLRRRKVQVALGAACGLVLMPIAGTMAGPAQPAWLWPILLAVVEGCLAFLLAFLILSLFIDREVARARATGDLVTDAMHGDAPLVTTGRGLLGYARRVAARDELAYKELKADIALLAAEGILTRSFAEIAADMAAAGHAVRKARQLLGRACDEGLLERIEGKPRYRIVAASKTLPAIADVVRARVPGIAGEAGGDGSTGLPASRQGAIPGQSLAAGRSGSRDAVASRPVPAWVQPGGDAGMVPGLVPAVLRRLRLSARPATLHPRVDRRTGTACIVTRRHVDKHDGTEQVTAVLVPAGAAIDDEKLRQVAAARHRLIGTARSIAPAGASLARSGMPGAMPGIAESVRVLVDRSLLEPEQFYLCAEREGAWIFVRRAEVRRARVPEVSVVKGLDVSVAKGDGAAVD